MAPTEYPERAVPTRPISPEESDPASFRRGSFNDTLVAGAS